MGVVMPGPAAWITIVRGWGPRLAQWRLVRRVGIARPLRVRVWLLNVAVFLGLTVPTLVIGSAGWPLRIAATAGLIGTCVWEGVALRLGRFPIWADVLETVAIGVVSWPPVARITRGEVLSLRSREFVQAAVAMGQSDLRIIVTQVLPNVLSPVIVAGSLLVATAILLESALSFLGLGDPNLMSWGYMIGAARTVIVRLNDPHTWRA